MAFLTDAFITSMLGGATNGVAEYAALTGGDSGTKAAWIAAADQEVETAARRGGYSSVVAATPSPSSGAAFVKLQMIAFREWYVLANFFGRKISVGTMGEASQQLYVDSPTNPRTDLPGLERDALGGSSGGEIVNASDLTTTATPTEPRFTRTTLGGFS